MATEKFIMLIEDNPDDETLTQRALKKSNITNDIAIARDGVEALDFLFCEGRYHTRNPRKQPAVILLDLKLPKIGGHEVLRRLRADHRTQLFPIVILTSSKEEQDLINSYRLGANSYIHKPLDFNRFVETVGKICLYWLELNEHPPLPEAPKRVIEINHHI